MGSISPMSPEGGIPPSSKAKGPVIPKTSALKEAVNLSRRITQMWKDWSPEEWAENIINLEGRVAQLEGTSPSIERVKRAAEHHHFDFVFPVALDLKPGSVSFARNIQEMAKKVFESHSLEQFHCLSPMQQREVMRYASGGKS